LKHTDKNRRPVVQKPYFENIPQELREMRQWVLWRYEWKDSGEGSWSKVPRQVNGDHAASDNPATWSTFAEAQMAWKTAQAKYDGIGFVFTKECGVIGVDVDNCVISENEDGLQLNLHALHARSLCDSYAEVSPSGTGIHIIGFGQLPRGFKDSKTGIEGYASGRYFTFTGQPLNDTIPLRDITTGATQLHNEFRERQAAGAKVEVGERQQPTRTGLSVFDRLEKAFKAKNGDQVRALFNGQLLHHESQSEADLALCAYLGFYSDGDPGTLDAMFRQSQAYSSRKKWDERHGEQTYGQMTIDKALSTMTEFYDPQRVAQSTVQVSKPTSEPALEAQPSQRRAHIFTFKEAVPAMLKWRHTPALAGVSTGWSELDEYYRPVKRYMTVVTGYPNHGKSAFIDNLAARLYEYAGWRFGFLSFETQPIAMHAACISSLLLNKPYSPRREGAFTDDDALSLAETVDDAFLFISPPEEDMTMERLLPYVAEIIRDPGIDGLIFDPFSELTPPSKLVGSMTHFVQGNLQKFRQFTRANDIASWLIAHPAKEYRNTKNADAKPKPPTLRDILDSAHFHNMADYGITVHRPNYGVGGDADHTEVINNKTRRGLPGKLGKVPFKYLGHTGGYEPMDPRLVVTRTIVEREDNWQ
jgi:hypothetical protein